MSNKQVFTIFFSVVKEINGNRTIFIHIQLNFGNNFCPCAIFSGERQKITRLICLVVFSLHHTSILH